MKEETILFADHLSESESVTLAVGERGTQVTPTLSLGEVYQVREVQFYLIVLIGLVQANCYTNKLAKLRRFQYTIYTSLPQFSLEVSQSAVFVSPYVYTIRQ